MFSNLKPINNLIGCCCFDVNSTEEGSLLQGYLRLQVGTKSVDRVRCTWLL